MQKTHHRDRALKLALIGLMTATIEVGKLALAFIPNVEVVTILCAVYGFVFGLSGMVATYLFVVIECFVWGVNSWVLTYFLYWPFVTFVFMCLGKFNIRNRIVATLTAVLLTTYFGVLSSLIDTGLLTGFWDRFWYRFSIIYVRGISFYVTQIVCNLILFLLLFRPLVDRLEKICPQKFASSKIKRFAKPNSFCDKASDKPISDSISQSSCMQNPNHSDISTSYSQSDIPQNDIENTISQEDKNSDLSMSLSQNKDEHDTLD